MPETQAPHGFARQARSVGWRATRLRWESLTRGGKITAQQIELTLPFQ